MYAGENTADGLDSLVESNIALFFHTWQHHGWCWNGHESDKEGWEVLQKCSPIILIMGANRLYKCV